MFEDEIEIQDLVIYLYLKILKEEMEEEHNDLENHKQ